MAKINDLFGYDSLAFFGRVNASISHELKNIMAIISETAGLLSDLSAMAQAGTPISADMITSSTESIIEEIQRGFTTIRQMNRFAHSVDTPVVSIDLMEILDLVRNLSEYLSLPARQTCMGSPGARPWPKPARLFCRRSFTRRLFRPFSIPVPRRVWISPFKRRMRRPGGSVLTASASRSSKPFPTRALSAWPNPSALRSIGTGRPIGWRSMFR
ncbi:hypothetical protein [Desulfosarcina cetonica]|uniref:hypothetical protein n=1 Tax=Desulfosarcina cetonica TaxID=90730 RepID=UPI0012ECBBB7|nr:hypothetical protein [Desulfosarcina cetonica]